MYEYLPLLIIGAVLGLLCTLFLTAYLILQRVNARDEKRQMPDRQIAQRLLAYAKPHRGNFILALLIMLVSIVYDLVSPLVVGHIERTVAGDFALPYLFRVVTVYAGILIVSLVCNFLQAMLLQKTGQKILS